MVRIIIFVGDFEDLGLGLFWLDFGVWLLRRFRLEFRVSVWLGILGIWRFGIFGFFGFGLLQMVVMVWRINH